MRIAPLMRQYAPPRRRTSELREPRRRRQHDSIGQMLVREAIAGGALEAAEFVVPEAVVIRAVESQAKRGDEDERERDRVAARQVWLVGNRRESSHAPRDYTRIRPMGGW